MREVLDVELVREALVTSGSPWAAVDGYATVDSTNLEALRDPRPWRVVVADHQSAGRGRMTRRWEAPPRASVAVSCVLPVGGAAVRDRGWLPLLTGMAMRGALAQVAGLAVGLKWPNDVLVPDGRKVSGVLCELARAGDVVVAGAGANIDQEAPELPVDTATSLRLCGVTGVRREDVVIAFARQLAALHRAWLEGGPTMAALRADYRVACLTLGRTVDVHRPGGTVLRGLAVEVDDEGRLVVDTPAGRLAQAAGDVVHVRPAGTGVDADAAADVVDGGPTPVAGADDGTA